MLAQRIELNLRLVCPQLHIQLWSLTLRLRLRIRLRRLDSLGLLRLDLLRLGLLRLLGLVLLVRRLRSDYHCIVTFLCLAIIAIATTIVFLVFEIRSMIPRVD